MKKEIKNEKNKNGIYSKTTITEKVSADGFVYENKENIATSWNETNNPPRSVWHKGYAKKASYMTNDPRITRPFVYGFCGVFLLIGIICLLFQSWFFGIVFVATAVLFFYTSQKDIDAIEENLRTQGHDMDSKEEKQKVRKEFAEEIKNNSDDVVKSAFTKNNFNNFKKITIPIYCIIAIITSLFIMSVVNIFLGIIILVLFTIIGIFYYYIISKVCKY